MAKSNRNAIGFNQPPGSGDLYPFVNPSLDIANLLGDFFVSFDDLADEVVLPLRVAWMAGFGDLPVVGSPYLIPPTLETPGWPVPTNAYDLVVLDANDRVVFDSTVAALTTTYWASRLRILEWHTSTAVCRCVMHLPALDPEADAGHIQLYATFILPENGELQADTWYKMPKRVMSLIVNGTRYVRKTIAFEEGYNVTLTHVTEPSIATFVLPNFNPATALAAGTRASNQIRIEAIPGAGRGTVPGCTEITQDLRTINNISSDAHQNFLYDGEGCIRTHRPVSLMGSTPRTLGYASTNPIITAKPNPAAQAQAAILTSNDCTNCCDCVYFAQTYQGIKRQWYLFQDVAHAAEDVRDIYTKNRARWLVQKQIREESKLRVRLVADGKGKVSWGVVFCNASKCCLTDVSLQLIFYQVIDGIYRAPTKDQYPCLPTMIEGSRQCAGPEPIEPDIDTAARGQVIRYNWDYSEAQSTTTLYGRHNIPDTLDQPEGSVAVRLWASLTWRGWTWDPVTQSDCVFSTYQSSSIDPQLQAFLASQDVTLPSPLYDQVGAALVPVSSLNSFCTRGSNCG